jgi:hypothetical protein
MSSSATTPDATAATTAERLTALELAMAALLLRLQDLSEQLSRDLRHHGVPL